MKKGVAPLPALRRSIRSARVPTRLVEEPAVDSQDDAPADTPADTPVVVGLRQQVEQLQAQLLASATLPAAPGSPVASSSRGWEETVPVAEPTLLLPPAVQPPAQDLLANALRQMAAPPATGEHLGVTTDIAQFFVLGATLDPKVKAKIREGAYVELGSLSSPSGSSVSVSMGTDGQPTIALTPVRARPPATILEWIRLFTTYASVYVETHPDEAPSLFSYIIIITDLQTRHAHRLSHYLLGYKKVLRDTLVKGFSEGFRIPSSVKNVLSTNNCYNHQSSTTHAVFVSSKLDRELAMGRLAGPFDVPTPINVIISPLGVVPKKTPGEYRLIHDLSFPKFNSVNSHINKFHTEVSYELLDHCITIIQAIGPKCLIAKADIKDAFRIIPIHPDDYRLLGFSWDNKFYHDKCLPMGCSTSCQTFELFATSLQWILLSVLGVRHVSHILDDFIFFGPFGSPLCATGLQAFIALTDSLNIPLRMDKTVLPSNVVSLHGIEIDTGLMQMRLPHDKLLEARYKITTVYKRKKVTLREMQSLIGTLNFACKVVMPGRTFLRRLIVCVSMLKRDWT